MVRIIMTADYEVFMGENYVSFDEVLYQPALEIGQIFKQMEIPVTFFVDSLFVGFLESRNEKIECTSCIENIRNLFRLGHAIELHIHPHWKYASLKGRHIEFDESHYSLPKIAQRYGDQIVSQIVVESINILRYRIMDCFCDYKINAFRAGGWSIQPERQILNLLIENEIKIDSSVLKGFYSGEDRIEYYDYRKTPRSEFWAIAPDEGVNISTNDTTLPYMLEVPVTSIGGCKGIACKSIRTIKRRIKREAVTSEKKGRSCLSSETGKDRYLKYLNQPIPFSLDNYYDFNIFKKYVESKAKDSEDHVVCFYFHPKLLSNDKIEHIKRFLGELKEIDNTSFIKIESIGL